MISDVVLTGKEYQSFPYTTLGALFEKSMLLDRDFLNSALGLCAENSSNNQPERSKDMKNFLSQNGDIYLSTLWEIHFAKQKPVLILSLMTKLFTECPAIHFKQIHTKLSLN